MFGTKEDEYLLMKQHLANVTNTECSVKEHHAHLRSARGFLFMISNKYTIMNIKDNKAHYWGLSRLDALKKINDDYGITLTQAKDIMEFLNWFKD